MSDISHLSKLAKLIRYDILTSTTQAASGHTTSSLSAVELMTVLFFGGFLKYDLSHPENIVNDRFILSKGHASPLLYALYHAAGKLTQKEILSLRQFDSVLEGHPTTRFKYVDVATGSLGQGLSAGIGMALAMRSQIRISLLPHVWVLLGDSEMAEGQVWEAMQIASHYKVQNLTGIIDVNRLGQQGKTMLGWNIDMYAERCRAFGWRTIELDNGHDLNKISSVFQEATNSRLTRKDQRPTMIIAKTIKGKGYVGFENKEGWHSKPLSKDELEKALHALGPVDQKVKGVVARPKKTASTKKTKYLFFRIVPPYSKDTTVSTKEAFGTAIDDMGRRYSNLVVLDGEVSNSTHTDKFKASYPERFYEMYIAEQNMVTTAVGMAKMGLKPVVSAFSSFFTRAYDQIRMAQYSYSNILIAGAYVGVSTGRDGPSGMGLEDISMMRSILDSVVVYPSDAIAAYKLTQAVYLQKGITYIRLTREKTPVLYDKKETFVIGGSKILRQDKKDEVVVFTAGITLHEALKAYELLKKQGIYITVVDLYSIKPLDEKTILALVKKTKNIMVVEDHYPTGGIGEAVGSLLVNNGTMKQLNNFIHLAATKIPRSGSPQELLAYEEIDASAIVKQVKHITSPVLD